jgi:hypothetical protein
MYGDFIIGEAFMEHECELYDIEDINEIIFEKGKRVFIHCYERGGGLGDAIEVYKFANKYWAWLDALGIDGPHATLIEAIRSSGGYVVTSASSWISSSLLSSDAIADELEVISDSIKPGFRIEVNGDVCVYTDQDKFVLEENEM